jgi:hypothetical protein
MDPDEYKPHRKNYDPIRSIQQSPAREALEQHIQQMEQSNRGVSPIDTGRTTAPEVEHEATQEPTRPEIHYGQRMAEGRGDYVSETRAAGERDRQVNREFYAHEAKASREGQDARAALDEHIKKGDRGELTPGDDQNVGRKTEIEYAR